MATTLAHPPQHWSVDEAQAMMDRMPETEEAVIEFGPADDAAGPSRRRFAVGSRLSGLGGDRRLVPITAVLGAIAIFGSLVSEWQTTDVDGSIFGDTEVGTRAFVATVADLDGWGGGYLAGLALLTPAVVLTLFGPAAGRRYARLAAFSVGGLLLAMLAAVSSDLGDTSRIVGQAGLNGLDEEQIVISYGRGIWCAIAGVALVVLAVYLAGRHAAPVTDVEAPAEEPPPVWSWRRPGTEEEEPPEAPFGLTVSPAKPFTASLDNRDKPS